MDRLQSLVFQTKGAYCRYCHRPAADVDHYYPRALGGATLLLNLEPVCDACRAEKGDTVPDPRPEEAAHRWWITAQVMNALCLDHYGLS